MEHRTRFTPRVRVSREFAEVGRTSPEFKESCDVNHILKKYQKTGSLPIDQRQSLYDDFSEVGSYQESLHIIMQAEEQFSMMEADVRKRFDNDPSKFLEFVNNPENIEEMYNLGLAKRPLQEPVEVAPEPEIIPEPDSAT